MQNGDEHSLGFGDMNRAGNMNNEEEKDWMDQLGGIDTEKSLKSRRVLSICG
jgi:hypothetical protein